MFSREDLLSLFTIYYHWFFYFLKVLKARFFSLSEVLIQSRKGPAKFRS